MARITFATQRDTAPDEKALYDAFVACELEAPAHATEPSLPVRLGQ